MSEHDLWLIAMDDDGLKHYPGGMYTPDAGTSEHPTKLYRGLQIDFPPELEAHVKEHWNKRLPQDESEIGGHLQIGPAVLDHLEKNHPLRTNEFVPESDIGMGRHWTADKQFAEIAAMQGGPGGHGRHSIVLEADHPGLQYLDPEHKYVGGTQTDSSGHPMTPWLGEDENTVLPGTPMNVTSVNLDGEEVLHDPYLEKWMPIDYNKPYNGGPQIRHASLVMTSDEDYRGYHRGPDAEYGASMDNPEMMFPDIYEHPQYYDTYSGFDHESTGPIMSARGKPDKKVSIYRALPLSALQKQVTKFGPGEMYEGSKPYTLRQHTAPINTNDWVTPSYSYAKQHGESNLDQHGPWTVVHHKVRAGDLYSEGNSIHEWAYNGSPVSATESSQGLQDRRIRTRSQNKLGMDWHGPGFGQPPMGPGPRKGPDTGPGPQQGHQFKLWEHLPGDYDWLSNDEPTGRPWAEYAGGYGAYPPGQPHAPGSPKKWYHVSPNNIDPGQEILPRNKSGIPSPGSEDWYGSNTENRQNYSWISPSLNEAEHWRNWAGEGSPIYEVKPHGGRPQQWNMDPGQGWAAPGATVKKRVD